MKKGSFGLVLCFYPIAAFICVILRQSLLCAVFLALAIFLEKDEWAGRQTVQAWGLSLLVSLFGDAVPWVVSLIPFSFLSNALSIVASVLSAIVYLGAIILSVMSIVRVMKDQEADVPLLSELAYRLYGKAKPAPKPGQYPPPYVPQQPAPPYSAGTQTVGPQTGGTQTAGPQTAGPQTGETQDNH